MNRINLFEKSWQLCGWRPFAWQIGRSMEIGMSLRADVAPIPTRLPGSVQSALLAAGLIKDWSHGLDSLHCEWVENRHWEFFAEIEAGAIADGQPVTLCADGLDYSGWILVDGKIAATFSGALKPHRIDLSAALGDGKKHVLGLVFDEPPSEQGQIGFTVRSRYFKPRNNYSWDFCPRMVTIGVWDALTLEIGLRTAELVRLSPRVSDSLDKGRIQALVSGVPGETVTLRVSKNGREVAFAARVLGEGNTEIVLELPQIELWWPNGQGAQPLYDVVLTNDSCEVLAKTRTGFKRIRWLPCEGAPEGALPWICEVNGRPVFLRGVNWVAVNLDYHSVTEAQYRQRIGLYRDMGCNVLRVWGGAFLEREIFYNLCDEAGLLVWQEFPLCSSGIDNWPPEDTQTIQELGEIARSYIRRRGHHASKLLWCGGNELQHAEGRKDGVGIPITLAHPCIAALDQVVAEEDPGTRFLPSSSSGPSFYAGENNFGKGIHHDVHGPWETKDIAQWTQYWAKDDALFRSETGMPGVASLEVLERYCGTENPWPPNRDNKYYRHTSVCWVQWDIFCAAHPGVEKLEARDGLGKYVEFSQALQAEALTIAVRACRERFPKCGGVILWMGHDVYPCPINTSIIDFEGTPKPAYYAVRELYRA